MIHVFIRTHPERRDSRSAPTIYEYYFSSCNTRLAYEDSCQGYRSRYVSVQISFQIVPPFIYTVRVAWYLERKNNRLFPRLKSLMERPVNRKQLRRTHLDSEVLYASRCGYVALLVKAPEFYINHSTKLPGFQAQLQLFWRKVAT